MMKIIERICEKLASKLEKRVIPRSNGKPYLERYYIRHSYYSKLFPGIYLHKFLSSDEERELHNHGWGTSISIVLTGGYVEERRHEGPDGFYVESRLFGPGYVNVIRKDTFHRIDLIKGCAWTLFISGNSDENWGFWNRESGKYWPHREFIKLRRRRHLRLINDETS